MHMVMLGTGVLHLMELFVRHLVLLIMWAAWYPCVGMVNGRKLMGSAAHLIVLASQSLETTLGTDWATLMLGVSHLMGLSVKRSVPVGMWAASRQGVGMVSGLKQ